MSGRVSYLGGIVKDGLVLNLDAGKKDSYSRSGTIWNDISDNKLVCTIINPVTFTNSNGGGIVFPGTAYAVIPNHPAINFGTGSFSIELMMYLYDTSHTILNKAAFGGGRGYGVAFLDGLLYFGIQGDVNYSRTLSLATAGISANNYYHMILICNRESGNALFYINGVLKLSQALAGSSGTTDSNSSLYVASAYQPYANQTRFVTRLYNRALSQQEVLQNYNAIKGRFNL